MSSTTPSDGLTRQKVVDTALALLNQVGLDGLTTRRLATELGVKSPALYWHFRNKQELIEEMAATLLLAAGMGGPRADESWRDWLRRRAHTYRRILLDHRDGARLVVGIGPGHAVLAEFDQELAALVERGFTALLALRAITTIAHCATGFVLQEQARPPAVRSDRAPPAAELPTLMAAVAAGGADPDASFDQSLALVLDGIAVRLADLDR
jgi:TetR/AcrR family tetracycline transcriptional repressor